MARRRRTFDREKCPDVWELTEHTSGYVENRNGIATLRYGADFRRSLMMEFIPKNRKRAVALGNQLVTEYKRKRAGLPSALVPTRQLPTAVLTVLPSALTSPGVPAIPGPNGPRAAPAQTVRSAWAEFKVAKLQGRGKGTLIRYRNSFKAFYPESDLPMDVDVLHSYFSVRLEQLRKEYKNNNLAKLTGCQVQFMDYCRDRRFIAGNPFALINVPKQKKKERVITYSDEEVMRIVQWFRKRAESEAELINPKSRTANQSANLILYLWTSACRIQETISLKDEKYVEDRKTENYITADQVVLNQTKNGEQRILPIDQLPGLREAIELQRPYIPQNGGFLFPWRDIQPPARGFKKCITALAADPNNPITIETGPNPLHAFRATAEGRWKRLNWSKEVITWLAGHSEEVYEDYYETKFTYEEIMERIPKPESVPSNVIPFSKVV